MITPGGPAKGGNVAPGHNGNTTGKVGPGKSGK